MQLDLMRFTFDVSVSISVNLNGNLEKFPGTDVLLSAGSLWHLLM